MRYRYSLPYLRRVLAVSLVLVAAPVVSSFALVESALAAEKNSPSVNSESTPAAPAASPSDRPDRVDQENYLQLLTEADQLYLQGRVAEAEQLYRKAKRSFTGVEFGDRPDPIFDPAQLPPAGQVYWREATAGEAANLPTRMLVPLQLLTEQYPEFIPGNLRYAEVLVEQDQTEVALAALERATTLYPEQPELAKARIDLLAAQKQWLDASIAARQFALLNPEAPNASEMRVLAEEYLDEFQDALREQMTGNAIANVVTGALSFVVTGGIFGPLSAIDSAVLLLQGESEVGENVAADVQRELDLIEDPEVVAYVNEVGQRLAAVTGRNDFEYEFYVLRDPSLNAFALPGGKVFINAGAIVQTQTEAELAGLLAHELSHAVLSHGFQMATTGNVTASVLLYIPYVGDLATDLTLSRYSRNMERQADTLGTRLLASAGYAADGLHSLMMTLQEQEQRSIGLNWLSTHPDTGERVHNLETLIQENGYNRYTYEGAERHQQIRARVEQILAAEEEEAKP